MAITSNLRRCASRPASAGLGALVIVGLVVPLLAPLSSSPGAAAISGALVDADLARGDLGGNGHLDPIALDPPPANVTPAPVAPRLVAFAPSRLAVAHRAPPRAVQVLTLAPKTSPPSRT